MERKNSTNSPKTSGTATDFFRGAENVCASFTRKTRRKTSSLRQGGDYQKQYLENPEKLKAYQANRKQYYLENKEKYWERKRQFRLLFPEREREYNEKYKASHRDEINEYHRNWKAKKRVEDIQYKLKENMSRYELNTMLRANGKKDKRTTDYLGCTIDFLTDGSFRDWNDVGELRARVAH